MQAVIRERYGVDADVPLALVEGSDDRRKIVACTTIAAECGVSVGGSLAAARGACADLLVVEHDPAHAAQALGIVADAVGIFGPIVSLSPPDSVLVDTTGVCGIEIRAGSFVEIAARLGFQARVAIATTPFAALALASHAVPAGSVEPRPSEQRRAVERLPLSAARLPAAAHESLRVVGIRTVGAFMALPPASLARRFGGEVRRTWRQAHGRAVPRLVPWEPDQPVVERARHDEEPLESLEPISFSLKTLLDRALDRLAGRGLAAEELVVQLKVLAWEDGPRPWTRGGAPSTLHTLPLDLGRPSDDALLLLQLLRERLSRSPPSGPVERITITVTRAASLDPLQLDLFGERPPAETMHATVARLAAILGLGQARFTPELREDYRPEQAFELVLFSGKEPKAPSAAPPGPRPARLLRSPEPLVADMGPGPPVGAVSGPERLVSGWWDGEPVARDYWVVADRWGRRSWVFRELVNGSWFLHGHFD